MYIFIYILYKIPEQKGLSAISIIQPDIGTVPESPKINDTLLYGSLLRLF